MCATFCGKSFASGWSTQDTILQGVVLAAFDVDRRQTLQIKNVPGLYETNPILGQQPTDVGVNNYFIVVALVHTGIAYLLPRYRTMFQAVTIGVEAGVIGNNYSLGLRWVL